MRATPSNRCFRPLPLAAAIALALVPGASHALTYTVTSGMDNSGVDPTPGAGSGTLRQAIVDANANCVADPNPVIAFAIGTSPTFIGIGAPAVTTNNPLPALQCGSGPYSPTIDGTTQPGHVTNTDPTGYNGTYGILIIGNGLTAAGVCGITFSQPIAPYGGALTIRGLRLSSFNFSSNNAGICGTNMNVLGNALDQNGEGVKVFANGTAIIGNNNPGDRNYMHGNNPFGVNIVSANTVNVVNNFIGTTPDGNGSFANGIGVNAQSTASVQINGNIISANSAEGVRLFNTPSLIIGNTIGLGVFGAVLPNTTGIRTDASSGGINISGNTIVHNSQYGVHVATGVGVNMVGNSITANNSKNVNLDMYGGAIINDFQDPDGGSNRRQNHPVITSVTPSGPDTLVTYTFNSTPGGNFQLEFCSNPGPGIPGCNASQAIGATLTNANGDATTTSIMLTGVHDFISAAATDTATNDTSEFSPIVQATAGLPAVTITPAALSFGNVPVNTTSSNMTANLLSTGGSAYQISQMSTGSCYGGPICYGGAEFTCMTDCIAFNPYNPGQSCNLTANFHPTFTGPQSVNVVVCDNATGSPRTIVVSGNGVPAASLTLTPSFFDFGDVPVGTRSPPAFFRLQNPSPSPVSFTTATNGPFAVVATNCVNPIPASGACDIDVAFDPVAEGLATGNVVVQPSSGSPATSNLHGNGTVAPVLGAPSLIDIAYTLGAPPTVQRVTISNNGQAPLDISSITLTGANFTLDSSQCPPRLPPGSSCDLFITFSAQTLGTFNGTLTIMTNAPGGSRAIPVRGLSQPRDVPFLEVTPREIGYGDLAFGTASDGERVLVRNIGGATAVFDSIVVSPDFVILSHTCNAPLPPQATCEAMVALRPLAYGLRIGALTIRSNAENSPNAVEIFGTSCRTSSLVAPRLGVPRGCAP